MSKVLRISKHKLDLAQVELSGPSLIIGRSPLCDQILRAPGIMPVHFLLEWIGEGEFNSNEGMWVLFDMAHLLSGVDANNHEDLSAEGILIDNDQQYLGFSWDIVEDRIKATQFNKGIISDQLISNSTKKINYEATKLALEIVSLDKLDQRIKDVWHYFTQFKTLGTNQLPFSINWTKEDQADFDFPIKPSLILNLKGQKYDVQETLKLLIGETFIIHFSHEIFFVRFVNRVEYSSNKFQLSNNKFTFIGFLSLILFCFILWNVDKVPTQMNKEIFPPEVRVVKVLEPEVIVPIPEVIATVPEVIAPVPEVVPPPPVIPEAENLLAETEIQKLPEPKPEPKPKPKPEPKVEVKPEPIPKPAPKIEIAKVIMKESKNTAVAPSFKSESGPEKVGLNSPAKVSDINAVGLLGKIKNSGGSKSNQISAEAIGQTFVDNTASGNDNRGVIVRNSQSGILGASNSIDSGAVGSGTNNLMEAQTTLRGAKDFSVTNSGPIAKAGALKDKYSIGSNGGTNASSKLSGSNGSGKDDGTDGSGQVAGGLTKAQVYKVINAHRREIRTCFESALIVRNDLNGILRLSFGINLAGSVTDVKIVNSELNSNILEGCVTQVIRQMKFPESLNKQSTTVIYPFVFKRSF